MKKLLLSALAMIAGITAHATTLWTGEYAVNWGDPLTVSADNFADCNVGDVFHFTVSDYNASAGWPQIGFRSAGEDIEGSIHVVGPDVYDVVVTGDILKAVKKNGLSIVGEDCTLSQIDVEAGVYSGSDQTIWLGNWTIEGDDGGASPTISNCHFSNVRAGDVIKTNFTRLADGTGWISYKYQDKSDNWAWKDYPASDEGDNANKGYTATGETLTVTEEMVDNLKTYGLFFYCKNVNITSVELIPIQAEPDPRSDLSLDNLGSGWSATYDAETHTITSEGGGKGWWLSAKDFSFYDYLVIQFDPAIKNDGKLVVEYNDADASNTNLVIGQKTIVVPLSEEGKSSVKQIYIQGSAGSTYTLSAAYVATEAYITENGVENEVEEVEVDPFFELNPANATAGWGERTYDTETFEGTIVADNAASGWWIGGDYSNYDKVYVEMSAINIPQHEVEGEMKPGYAQLSVQCANDAGEGVFSSCPFDTHLYAVVDLNEFKNKVNQIVIQGSAGVTFTMLKAIVCTNEYYEENILPNLPEDPAPAMPTAIQTIGSEQADGAWYTLQGVRVAAPVKGVYIHNGKKMVLK